MSEQRFTFDYEVEFEIFDRVTKKHYDGTVGCQEKICDLLNEQQATINKVCELLEEEDIFSDEATEHDINAYIELQKFDNKDAYYLACGIKKAIKLLKGDDV